MHVIETVQVHFVSTIVALFRRVVQTCCSAANKNSQILNYGSSYI